MRLLGTISGTINDEDRAFFGPGAPFDLPAAAPAEEEIEEALKMSFSLVTICNMALAKCGISQPIESLDFAPDATVPQEARMCALYWELAFQAAARGHNWGCLTTDADISANLAAAPVVGYDHAYSLPANCLRVVTVHNGDRPWARRGNLLCTDATEVRIEYVQYTLQTELYDPLFVEALVMRLAAHLAPALLGEGAADVADGLIAWHERVSLPLARFVDSSEQSVRSLDIHTWRDSRR